mgnify:CR=1 FL=1
MSEADSLMEHLSEVCLQVLSDLMYLTEEIAVHDTPVLHKLSLKTAKGTEIKQWQNEMLFDIKKTVKYLSAFHYP